MSAENNETENKIPVSDKIENKEHENENTLHVISVENLESENNSEIKEQVTTESENNSDPLKALKEPLKTDNKAKKRFSVTTNFSEAEGEIIEMIVKARQKAGLTENTSHFIQQCVDFTINYNAVKPQFSNICFAVPDEYKPKLFRKGFYQANPRIKIELCK